MHCAFAKYEQGFKRKNEYLERRRVKRKEEIERGVQSELKKRGMQGELDDPLLMSSVPGGTSLGDGTRLGIQDGESSLGLGGGVGEDSAISITKLGKDGGLGIEDSELSNTIVGVNSSKKSKTKSMDVKSKKKDKKKKKSKSAVKTRGGATSTGHGMDSDDDTHLGGNPEESTMRIRT